MAHSDKNIVITPARSSSTVDPRIVFSGADASTGPQNITVTAYPANGGTLSIDGSAGQLFSVSNSLTGTLFAVNDISGIPSIEVLDTGLVRLAPFNGDVSIGGRLYGTKLHNNTGSMTGAVNQYIGSGTYTPTLVNGTNTTSTSAVPCNWMRVGNVVHVSGYVFAAFGAGGTTDFTMSYPIPSTATNTGAVGGTAIAMNGLQLFAIRVDGSNGRAQFSGQSSATGNANLYFTFMYLIA